MVDLLTSPISLYLRLLYDHGVCAYFFSLSSLYFHLLIYISLGPPAQWAIRVLRMLNNEERTTPPPILAENFQSLTAITTLTVLIIYRFVSMFEGPCCCVLICMFVSVSLNKTYAFFLKYFANMWNYLTLF